MCWLYTFFKSFITELIIIVNFFATIPMYGNIVKKKLSFKGDKSIKKKRRAEDEPVYSSNRSTMKQSSDPNDDEIVVLSGTGHITSSGIFCVLRSFEFINICRNYY
jgi:hypothetical protein